MEVPSNIKRTVTVRPYGAKVIEPERFLSFTTAGAGVRVGVAVGGTAAENASVCFTSLVPGVTVCPFIQVPPRPASHT